MFRILVVVLNIFLLLMLLFSCDSKPSDAQKQVLTQDSLPISISKFIIFFGNSLTAGYGLEPSEAFPAFIQQKIDSLNLPYKVVNAGLSGETTAGGVERVDWILKQHVDVFVLELGANDGLRGTPVDVTKENLIKIIDKVRAKNPEVHILLAGMEAPPNMGLKFVTDFKGIYQAIAKEKNVALIPFLLQDVAGKKELNQADGIHPTAKGQKIIAETVWKSLKPLL
jgi:acyl-CoA thioesterase-1